MTVLDESEFPWVIIRLNNLLFGLSSAHVSEMVAMPKIVAVPNMPHFARGVINLRGRVMPLFDLRLRLGMSSSLQELDELIEQLEQRERDHRNWLVELENSVKERREFTLATDPHQCAFGQWYDHFQTDNLVLSGFLQKFDAPHRQIHEVAIDVKKFEKEERFDEALRLIDDTRNGLLAHLVQLFAEARKLLRELHREIAIVLDHGSRPFAVAVDSIESVEYLVQSDIKEMGEIFTETTSDLVTGIGKRAKTSDLVQILDTAGLLAEACETEEMALA